jgi:hypothetical protein
VAPTVNGVNILLANNHIETDFGSNAKSNGPGNPSSSCITCHYLASIGTCPSGNQSINRALIFKSFGSGYQTGTGFTGAFPSAQFTSSGGPYLSTDFVWSVQEAPWASGNSCPSAGK